MLIIYICVCFITYSIFPYNRSFYRYQINKMAVPSICTLIQHVNQEWKFLIRGGVWKSLTGNIRPFSIRAFYYIFKKVSISPIFCNNCASIFKLKRSLRGIGTLCIIYLSKIKFSSTINRVRTYRKIKTILP